MSIDLAKDLLPSLVLYPADVLVERLALLLDQLHGVVVLPLKRVRVHFHQMVALPLCLVLRALQLTPVLRIHRLQPQRPV